MQRRGAPASRLTRGLAAQAFVLSGSDGDSTVVPDEASMTPAPLDRFVTPVPLDGGAGLNRCEVAPQVPVNIDIEAVNYYLRTEVPNAHTKRLYARVIERLVLWSIIAKGMPVSSLAYDDFFEYQIFLGNPRPVDLWIGKDHQRRDSREWRPFTAPLSIQLQRTEFGILRKFFAYLVDVRYLKANPVPESLARLARTNRPQGLGSNLWPVLKESLEQLPLATRRDRLAYARIRWLFALLGNAHLSLAQLIQAKMTDVFIQKNTITGDQYWLKTHDRNGGLVAVPLSPEVVDELKTYRLSMECAPLPFPHERTPLIIAIWGMEFGHLTSLGLGQSLKKNLRQAANYARAAGYPESLAVEIENASARWLMPARESRQVAVGPPAEDEVNG